MAGSYFELLTEQEGMPAKPFDPVGELKRLRRRLALRMIQVSEPQEKASLSPCQWESETKDTVTVCSHLSKIADQAPTHASLEMVVKKVGSIKKTLVLWQRSRSRRKSPRTALFRGNRQFWCNRRIPAVVSQYLTAPKEGMLETVNAGLTVLGVVGIVFGVLNFLKGWENDLSLGWLVSVSGLAVITIGLSGRFLASRSDLS